MLEAGSEGPHASRASAGGGSGQQQSVETEGRGGRERGIAQVRLWPTTKTPNGGRQLPDATPQVQVAVILGGMELMDAEHRACAGGANSESMARCWCL